MLQIHAMSTYPGKYFRHVLPIRQNDGCLMLGLVQPRDEAMYPRPAASLLSKVVGSFLHVFAS